MAERSDASPTGDPLIAQSEREADARRAARAANLFDLRRLIGGLFVIYGVILVVMGLGASDAAIEKSADVNVNLWAGLGMLLFGLGMLAWAFLRPLSEQLDEAAGDSGSSEAASRAAGADRGGSGGGRGAGG
jgi:hypothetical protein